MKHKPKVEKIEQPEEVEVKPSLSIGMPIFGVDVQLRGHWLVLTMNGEEKMRWDASHVMEQAKDKALEVAMNYIAENGGVLKFMASMGSKMGKK